MEGQETQSDTCFLSCLNENGTSVSKFLQKILPNQPFFIVQMVPLIKKSTDTLVEKIGEKADKGESIEIMALVPNNDNLDLDT